MGAKTVPEALLKTHLATPSVAVINVNFATIHLFFFLKLSTVIGLHGQPMEPVANPVEEAPKPDPGGTTRPYKQALAFQVNL